MPRLYVQLQVDFADDDKIARLARYGKDARACRDLLVQMWCYCKREKSDGEVPAEIVGKLAYPDPLRTALRDADRLVEVGLASHIEGGYLLHGYLKHNKSKAEIEKIAKEKAEAGKKGGLASGQLRSVEANAKHSASPPRSQRTENREQSSELNLVKPLGGDRNETLRSVGASEPHCSKHPLGDSPDRCSGCARVREWRDRNEITENERRAKVRAECRACAGSGWIEDAEGNPATKCDHRRTA